MLKMFFKLISLNNLLSVFNIQKKEAFMLPKQVFLNHFFKEEVAQTLGNTLKQI